MRALIRLESSWPLEAMHSSYIILTAHGSAGNSIGIDQILARLAAAAAAAGQARRRSSSFRVAARVRPSSPLLEWIANRHREERIDSDAPSSCCSAGNNSCSTTSGQSPMFVCCQRKNSIPPLDLERSDLIHGVRSHRRIVVQRRAAIVWPQQTTTSSLAIYLDANVQLHRHAAGRFVSQSGTLTDSKPLVRRPSPLTWPPGRRPIGTQPSRTATN